jgi:hypothetical protein
VVREQQRDPGETDRDARDGLSAGAPAAAVRANTTSCGLT